MLITFSFKETSRYYTDLDTIAVKLEEVEKSIELNDKETRMFLKMFPSLHEIISFSTIEIDILQFIEELRNNFGDEASTLIEKLKSLNTPKATIKSISSF